jgi:minor extracellular protease Epr
MEESNPSLHRLHVDSVLSKFAEPKIISPLPFGLKGTGRGVKILLVDSGVPDHDAIINVGGDRETRSVNFTNSPTVRDMVGHSTVVAGIIGANDPEQLVGVAPDAEFFFAKAVDDRASTRLDAIIASLLWGLIKEVDLIVLPFSSDMDSLMVHDVIRKAFDAGICVIAPTGKDSKTSYPAVYNQCLAIGSVCHLSTRFSATGDIDICGEGVPSCYLEQTFVTTTGTTCSTAIAAGLTAIAIENGSRALKRPRPIDIYEQMMGLNKRPVA